MMRNSEQEQAIREIRRPLVPAHAYLSLYFSTIRRTWTKLLVGSKRCAPYAALLMGMQLQQRLRDLGVRSPKTYCEESELQGLDLGRKGVPAECVSVAVTLFVKSCLASVKCDDARRAKWTRALARWSSVYQFLLLSGFTQFVAAEREALEEKTRQAEQRARDFSVVLAEAYEKERRHLAHDLHDEIGHDLIVLKLYTQVIALDLKKGDLAQVRKKLNQSVSLIKHALRSVRHLTFDLGPAVWGEQGFISAVRMYVRQFAQRTGLQVRFSSFRLKVRLPTPYETALYKLLQGALSNVAAHAAAEHVLVNLSSRKGFVVLKVEDDGKGFSVARKLHAPRQSYGLRAMWDRVELLGGSIAFESKPVRKGNTRRGTTIEFLLPDHGLEGL